MAGSEIEGADRYLPVMAPQLPERRVKVKTRSDSVRCFLKQVIRRRLLSRRVMKVDLLILKRIQVTRRWKGED